MGLINLRIGAGLGVKLIEGKIYILYGDIILFTEMKDQKQATTEVLDEASPGQNAAFWSNLQELESLPLFLLPGEEGSGEGNCIL